MFKKYIIKSKSRNPITISGVTINSGEAKVVETSITHCISRMRDLGLITISEVVETPSINIESVESTSRRRRKNSSDSEENNTEE